jgi:xanthine dehydrogenase/oxidase
MGVMKCCDEINARLHPVRDRLGNDTKWEELIKKSFLESIDLTGYYRSGSGNRSVKNYMCYSACFAEVEVDVLTGQYQILQVDYICDTGRSLNPRLDLGQLEGGFIMGCGLFLLESSSNEPPNALPLTTFSGSYKPPLAKDLPVKFNAKLLKNAPNPKGVLGSKAVGETPVASGACPLFALKRAVEAARSDIGDCSWFPMDAPASVKQIHTLCSTTYDHFTLSDKK